MLRKKLSAPSVRARKKAGKENLAARLELPILDPDKLARLRSPNRRPRTIAELAGELESFRAVSDAMRRSDRYYFSALSKVYGVWADLLVIDIGHRNEMIAKLNERNAERTKRGDALHVLLRALIDYRVLDVADIPSDEAARARQATWTRLSRDASVLRFAEREEVPVDDFVAFVKARPGGLEGMAREEARARRAAAGAPTVRAKILAKSPAESPSSPPSPSSVALETGKTQPDSKRGWRLGATLRKTLASGMFADRELIVRVYVGADGRRTVRDVYQSSKPAIDDAQWVRDMEGLGARLVGKGLKRPKV